jgi:hypothetical protein
MFKPAQGPLPRDHLDASCRIHPTHLKSRLAMKMYLLPGAIDLSNCAKGLEPPLATRQCIKLIVTGLKKSRRTSRNLLRDLLWERDKHEVKNIYYQVASYSWELQLRLWRRVLSPMKATKSFALAPNMKHWPSESS